MMACTTTLAAYGRGFCSESTCCLERLVTSIVLVESGRVVASRVLSPIDSPASRPGRRIVPPPGYPILPPRALLSLCEQARGISLNQLQTGLVEGAWAVLSAAIMDQFSAHSTTGNRKTTQRAAARDRMVGRVCVVGGAGGIVGSGICRQLLMEGAKVVALIRREEVKEGLLKECQGAPVKNLFPVVVADVSEEDQCSECIKQILAEHGEIDHAVSCFGAWWQKGVLTEQTYSEFLHVINDFAGSHFTFAKHVLPAMKKADTSSFLFITGGVGKRVLSADSGLATVGGASVYGIVLAAQAEFANAAPRINEMRIYALVTRHGEVPKSQSHIVRNLRAHSNRKIGNLAAEALVTAGHDERFDVSSERLDGVMLMVGD